MAPICESSMTNTGFKAHDSLYEFSRGQPTQYSYGDNITLLLLDLVEPGYKKPQGLLSQDKREPKNSDVERLKIDVAASNFSRFLECSSCTSSFESAARAICFF